MAVNLHRALRLHETRVIPSVVAKRRSRGIGTVPVEGTGIGAPRIGMWVQSGSERVSPRRREEIISPFKHDSRNERDQGERPRDATTLRVPLRLRVFAVNESPLSDTQMRLRPSPASRARPSTGTVSIPLDSLALARNDTHSEAKE